MPDHPDYNRLRELSWRRRLTDAEQAELRALLAAHPETRADWELEAMLSEAWARLPDAPVPSNFTARVLQQIERPPARRKHAQAPWWNWSWRVWLRRAAVAAAVVAVGVFAFEQHEAAKRSALAKQLVAVYGGKPVPNPDSLENFDAIRRLNSAPRPDPALLLTLQ